MITQSLIFKKGVFFQSHHIHSWTRTLLMKEDPSQGFIHHWFPPQGATNNDVSATYLHPVALAQYISLKTAEGARKFSLKFFRSVLNSFLDTRCSNSFITQSLRSENDLLHSKQQ